MTIPNGYRALMAGVLRESRRRQAEITGMLRRFVERESPSTDKAAVDRLGEILQQEWRSRGAKIRVLEQVHRGNHVRAEMWLGSGKPAGQILVLGHMDTVYPLGTLQKTPFRISGERVWGPGTFDMKAGLVMALFAVDVLKSAGIRAKKRTVFLWTSDEEIGSESSRKAIEREASQSDAVLVLEPSLGEEGKLKTARKGVGGAEICFRGRAAHAGIDPEKGVNAVHELALQIERLMKLNAPERGVTVQATVISGGTAANVVPEEAHATIDLRYSRARDGKALERNLSRLRPILPGARVEVRNSASRAPLERTEEVRELFRHAQNLMEAVGIPLDEASTGGGSDGNFTAALGIPTLDGLGAVGDGAHSPKEHIVLRALPERTALLAGLLATL